MKLAVIALVLALPGCRRASVKADVYTSVTNGYPEKGMRPWGPMLGTARIRAVTAFVLSIKGKNVAGGRPPQGTIGD